MAVANETLGNNTALPSPPEASWYEPLRPLLVHVFDALVLLAFIAAGWLAGRLIRAVVERSRGGAPTSGRILAGKTIVLTGVLLGLAAGLRVAYHADLGTTVAALGLVSLALGFGLQNTVANLAAGVSLSLDKPFEVGDRIQVGETWGDVVGIGLRSTRIRTTSGQYVVVPNAILDTREVWNNTYGSSSAIRVEVPLSISYESSLPLAEDLALKAARSCPEVLAYPSPVLRVRHLGDNGVELEIRCWIHHAGDKARVVDQLLRTIKRDFDAQGVVFPFPQRTVGYLKDQVHPAPTPAHLTAEVARPPLVLVCTRSLAGARRFAEPAAEFAARTGAAIMVLHIRPPFMAPERIEGEQAVNTYLEAASHRGVSARGRLEVGPLPQVVAQVAKEEGAQLVLFGRANGTSTGLFGRDEVQAAKALSTVPFLAMAPDQLLREEVVEHWQDRLHARTAAPKS